jgi:hypothetical protein
MDAAILPDRVVRSQPEAGSARADGHDRGGGDQPPSSRPGRRAIDVWRRHAWSELAKVRFDVVVLMHL